MVQGRRRRRGEGRSRGLEEVILGGGVNEKGEKKNKDLSLQVLAYPYKCLYATHLAS